MPILFQFYANIIIVFYSHDKTNLRRVAIDYLGWNNQELLKQKCGGNGWNLIKTQVCKLYRYFYKLILR